MSIIEQVFVRNIVETVIIAAMLIGIFLLIRLPIKSGDWSKWIYAAYAVAVLTAMTVLLTGLVNIYLDIKEEEYVTYRGDYEEKGGGVRDLKTVVIYGADGEKIKLLRTGASEAGKYTGTVIYGKRSKIIVEYSGISIYDDSR